MRKIIYCVVMAGLFTACAKHEVPSVPTQSGRSQLDGGLILLNLGPNRKDIGKGIRSFEVEPLPFSKLKTIFSVELKDGDGNEITKISELRPNTDYRIEIKGE